MGSLDKKDAPENGEKDIVYPSYDEDPAKAARGSSKARYRGNFENGQWHGKGLLINEDGDVYDGEFKRDLKHGQGSYATSDGTVFTGTWDEGTPVGEAHINFRNGESYQGQVSRGGAMDGKGGYKWPNGSRYDGNNPSTSHKREMKFASHKLSLSLSLSLSLALCHPPTHTHTHTHTH